MSKPTRPGEATPRRDFLRALALAPAAAAVAGCATSTGAGLGQEAPSGGSGSRPDAARAAEEKSLHALRAHPLPMDAEPALVFRAAPARPVE